MISKIFETMSDVSLNKQLILEAKKKYNLKAIQVEKMNFKIAL